MQSRTVSGNNIGVSNNVQEHADAPNYTDFDLGRANPTGGKIQNEYTNVGIYWLGSADDLDSLQSYKLICKFNTDHGIIKEEKYTKGSSGEYNILSRHI